MTIRNARTGGQILIDQLVAQGVERVTCVPGESYLAALDALNAIDGVTCRKAEGAFYTYASCAGLIGRRSPDGSIIDSDCAFCRYLLERHDVAVVPGSCFGLAPYFRLSYATSEQNLREAVMRIAKACRELS